MHRFAQIGAAILLAMLSALPVQAQWQVPNHAMPVGRGAGVTGFHSAPPSAAGQVLTDQGNSADPAFAFVNPANVPYTAPATGAVATTVQARLANSISVTDFGALGNSNGTHGNGHDDTAAFNAAIAAAVASQATSLVYVPCGTYRLTSTVAETAVKLISIVGASQTCSRIYLDNTTGIPTFSFVPASACGAGISLPYCALVSGLQFIAPNSAVSGQVAINFNQVNSTIVENSIFVGQYNSLKYLLSYSPAIYNSGFFHDVDTSILSTDNSFNAGKIIGNAIVGGGVTDSVAAISIGPYPTAGCAEPVWIERNDLEGNYADIGLNGVCSANISNYQERGIPFIFGGNSSTTNTRIHIGPYLFDAAASVGFTVQNVSKITFDNSTFFSTTVTLGSNVSQVVWSPTNSVSSGSIPATPTVTTCTGVGTGGTCVATGTNQAGYITLTTGTGSSAAGSLTLTFAGAIGSSHSACTWTPAASAGSWTSPATFVSNNAGPTSNGGVWHNGSGALTDSSSYLLEYQCSGIGF